jgi:hypothetical protein
VGVNDRFVHKLLHAGTGDALDHYSKPCIPGGPLDFFHDGGSVRVEIWAAVGFYPERSRRFFGFRRKFVRL